MKIIEVLSSRTPGMITVMALMLLIPGISESQTNTATSPDTTVIPWLGIWEATDTPISQDIKAQQAKAVLEIRPTASGRGFDINRNAAEKSITETVIPDGIQRATNSSNCNRSQAYNWEPQTGLLLGSLEIKCKDSASYNISNLKMIVSANEMVDILAIKTSGQTRVAVRHFKFTSDLPSAEESLTGQDAMVMRTALAAPWDLNKIIHLAKVIDTPVLEAALLEKNTQFQLNSKLLKQLNSAKIPKSIIDLLIAMANPDKFQIVKNGRIATVLRAANNAQTDKSSVAQYPRYSPWEYNGGFYGVPGYYPWDYWSYNSPFWLDYPIYINYPYNPGNSGGNGGGGGTPGPPNPNSDGRLSSGSGYIQVTPRDTGHRAVPRNSYVPTSGSPAGYSGSSQVAPSSSGASAPTYTPSPSGGGSYSSGSSATPSSSGGGSQSAPSAPSASPSGYSSGSGGGSQAVPRQ